MGRMREICLVVLAGFIFQFGYTSEARICPPKTDKGVIEGVGNIGGSSGINVDINADTRKPIDKPLTPQPDIQKTIQSAEARLRAEEEARKKAEEEPRQKNSTGDIYKRLRDKEKDRSDYRREREVADALRGTTTPTTPGVTSPTTPPTGGTGPTTPTTGGTGPTPTSGGTTTTTTPGITSPTTPSPKTPTTVTGTTKTSATTPTTDQRRWIVWHGCGDKPGWWCDVHLEYTTENDLRRRNKALIIMGAYQSEKEALQGTCAKFGNIWMGGEFAHGALTTIGGSVYCVGELVYWSGQEKRYKCREPKQ